MKQFSHSKLATYERCPLQYKLQYIIKLKPKQETTVEAFMGSRVHNVLELLYRDLLKTKINSLKDLFEFYDKIWRVAWKDDIVINNKEYNQKHYYNLGKKCVENYYEKYQPFNQDQTIGIEKKVSLEWGEYNIIGYIDRLAREKKDVYVIHDYKTNGSIMEQQYADKDRQLALYSIAVKQNFKQAKEIKLIWHFVAFGEDVVSERTSQELQELKDNILSIIKEINIAEKDDNFPAKETNCAWCGFWQHCPKKKHLFKIEKIPQNEYLKDDGVKLANKYIKLSEEKSKINKNARTEIMLIEQEMEKIEQAILKYSQKHKIDSLHGDNCLVAINRSKDYSFPTRSADLERYEKFESLLKETKYWKDVSVINMSKLGQMLESGDFDRKIKNEILKLSPIQENVRIKLSFRGHPAYCGRTKQSRG